MKSVADQRLELALEAARLGTWTWDMAAGATAWDPRLEEMHGMAPGGFGGSFEDWLASLYPEDRAECLARVDRALANPGPYTLAHRTIWPDGSVHHIECRGMVLVDDDGIPIGTTGVAIDVTERERHKKALSDALVDQHQLLQTLQQALLPSVLPRVDGVTLATRYVAAQRNVEIGGDWYAVVPLRDNRLGVAIGDVAGHGLDAVADMAAARFSLRALALNESAPEVVLEKLNEVVRVFESDTMITAVYGVIDPQAGTWTFASAGHCPALVRHSDGQTVVIEEASDPPLGFATTFRRRQVELPPGATLLLYTDGLIERRTEPLDVGIDWLVRACNRGPTDPEALCDFLIEARYDGAVVEDDVALVAASLE